MDIVTIAKLVGAGVIEKDLEHLLTKHVTSVGYQTLGDLFAAGAEGCKEKDPSVVAQAVTHLLFSIH